MENLGLELKSLYTAAVAARERAYAPYSKFKVGAAVMAVDGSIYQGCNVENASYGLTCCAERNAIFTAVGQGHTDLEAICIVAATEGPVSPCGACRQVMAEFKIKRIIMANMEGAMELVTLEELLPGQFSL